MKEKSYLNIANLMFEMLTLALNQPLLPKIVVNASYQAKKLITY